MIFTVKNDRMEKNMILFTVTLIAYIFNTVFNLLALFKAKNKKQTIKSDTTDTPLYILMIVNFLLVPDIMFNVTITIINLVNILLDTFRFIRNPLNNKSLLINVTINISYILLSFLLLGVCIQKSVKIVATGGNLLLWVLWTGKSYLN